MNSVNSLAQSPDGYLWLGTEAGLLRFDGLNFALYKQENTPAFLNSIVSALFVDSGGVLWVGLRGGGLLKNHENKFTHIQDIPELTACTIWKIAQTRDGVIWLATNVGLFMMTPAGIKRPDMGGELDKLEITQFLEDRSGRIWIAALGRGLAWLIRRGDHLDVEFLEPGFVRVLKLMQDRRGDVWIGTSNKGLYRYRTKLEPMFSVKNGLSNNTVYAIFEDRFGALWLGTDGGGIDLLPSHQRFIVPFHQRDEFPNNVIYDFLEDREGTLWIATGGGGLNSVRESKILTYTTRHGLAYNNVYGIFQDSRSRIWIGSKGYGLTLFENNKFRVLTTRDGLSSNSIVSMAEHPNGDLWLGSLDGTADRMRNGLAESFDIESGLRGEPIRCVYCTRSGDVIAGDAKGSLFKFNAGRFNLFYNANFRINTMMESSDGDLWVGTFVGGVIRFAKNGAIKKYTTDNGLSNNVITRLYEAKNGVVWVGSSMGLNRISGNSIDFITENQGLPDNMIYWFNADSHENFWVGCNSGIFLIYKTELDQFFAKKIQQVNCVLYGRESGMRSRECNGANHPAGITDRDGKMWFSTNGGASVVDPKNMGVNKIAPPVIIEAIAFDGDATPPPLTEPVPPGRNNLEFRFTAISFIVPEKIRFKYKLEGYDQKWVEAGAKRNAFYTDLPPGKYSFRVIACNSDGVWNSEGAAVDLELLPRFYQTVAFKIGFPVFLLLFISLTFLFLKKRITFRGLKIHTHQPIPEDEAKRCLVKLYYLLDEKRVYREADLTVKSLAAKMLLTQRYLSQIINDHLGKNFYEFISEYRIKEAEKMLSDPASLHRSVLDIAFDVGYNSKSTFNRAFKNVTGKTPSQYRSQKKQTQ